MLVHPPYLSGLSITYTEIMDLPVSRKNAMIMELNEMRKAEVAALSKLPKK